MWTEHQQYSTENQTDVIQAFAEARNLESVRIYADEGKSGLVLEGRKSLKPSPTHYKVSSWSLGMAVLECSIRSSDKASPLEKS